MADRRDAVATLRLKGVSKRRACQILHSADPVSITGRARIATGTSAGGCASWPWTTLATAIGGRGRSSGRRDGPSTSSGSTADGRSWTWPSPGPADGGDGSAAGTPCPSAAGRPAMSGPTTS